MFIQQTFKSIIMKTFLKLSILFFFLFTTIFVSAQVQEKPPKENNSEAVNENVNQTKTENQNTTESNRVTGLKTPDNSGTNDGQDQKPAASSKKGYDYYQAKSDLNSSGAKSKAQDHNSSRINKSASKIDNGNSSGNDEKRVNKVEAISIKQK